MHAGIQLYTLRDADRTVPELIGAVAETDLDGCELAGLPEEDDVAALGATDLSAPAVHVDLATIEDDPAGVARACRAFECDRVVVPWLPPEAFESAPRAREAGERVAAARAALREAGVECGYHNHDHEFVAVEGGTAFDAFLGAFDGPIELDLGWALAGGADPAALVRRLGGRCPLVHVKDVAVDESAPVALGAGDLDLSACRRACHAAGVEWAIYEHDDPSDPMAALADGAELVSAFREEPAGAGEERPT